MFTMPKFTRLLTATFTVASFFGVLGSCQKPLRIASSPATAGVVVEEVGKGSALAKGGIEPGDVLLSWRRLPSPPANPEEAQGDFESVFDWMWVVVEQAPRGTVELIGRHDQKMRIYTIRSGLWEATVRPSMPIGLLDDYQFGLERLHAGETSQAASHWQELATTAEAWSLRAWLGLRLGMIWAEHRDWEKSLAAYLSALEEAQGAIPRAVLWREIGRVYRKQSQFQLALQAYGSARKIQESTWGKESLALAQSQNALGAIAYIQGDWAQATELYGRAVAIKQKLAPDSLTLAKSLNNLALLAWDRSDLDQAETLHQQALQIRQDLAPDSIEVAQSLDNLGLVARGRWHLDQAKDLFLQALQIREGLEPGSLDVAYSLNNLGIVAWDRGNLDQAMSYFQDALVIRKELAPESLLMADSLASLGALAWRRWDLDRTEEFLQSALEIRQRLAPDGLQTGQHLYNLGLLAFSRGKLDQAMDFHQRALIIRQKLVPGSVSVASSLDSLGRVAIALGELDRAMDLFQRGLAIKSKQAPDSQYVAYSLRGLGWLAEESGNLVQAREYYERALKIQQEMIPGSSENFETMHALGHLYIQTDPPQLVKANDFICRALDMLESQLTRLGGSHDVRAKFRSRYGEYYRDALEVQLSLNQPAIAFHSLERSRARTFLEHFSERDVIFNTDISQDLDRERRRLAGRFDHTQRQLAGLTPRDHGERVEELRDQLRRLNNEAKDIEDRIRRSSPKLAALQYPEPLNLSSIQENLDPRTLLLSFSVGDDSTLLFTVSKTLGLDVDTLTIREADLRGQIEAFRRHIEQAHSPDSSWVVGAQELARRLYSALIEPIEDRIEDSDRLLILADGPLYYLPWGALVHDSEDGPQYLTEWKPVHHALSATVYAELRKLRRKGDELSAPVQIAAFGDPRYPEIRKAAAHHDDVVRSVAERGLFELERIPHTRHEVEAVTSIYPQNHVQAYLGNDATEKRAKALGRDVRVVHFATHAHLDERFPMNSFLALTIPDEYREGEDNGLLQVWEIYERLRIDADLVVLSACESALGEERRGEGLMGLTRAFQYAGARTVAASLWRVADEGTAELMIRFYRHLKDGKTKDEALRAAQMDLIHGEDERLRLPYYWAGFQIYGDWQ